MSEWEGLEYPNPRMRQYVWRKSEGRCWYCGQKLDPWDFHIDHFTPKSKGGSNQYENLVPACPNCNIVKNNRRTWDWSCDLQKQMGLDLNRFQLKFLKGEGINVEEDIYQWETPVIFWFQRELENDPRYFRLVRYKGWQP